MFTSAGSSLTRCSTILKKVTISKHSSLLQTCVNYGCKKFISLGPGWQQIFVCQRSKQNLKNCHSNLAVTKRHKICRNWDTAACPCLTANFEPFSISQILMAILKILFLSLIYKYLLIFR